MLCCVLSFKMGFWVCGSGGVRDVVRSYLNSRRANRGSRICTAVHAMIAVSQIPFSLTMSDNTATVTA